MFLWDHLAYRRQPVFAAVDPWVALTVMAMRTERVLLGPMVPRSPGAVLRSWPGKPPRSTTSRAAG